MLIFKVLRKQNFRLEKIIFLPKKCIYFLTYRNEHPVYISKSIYTSIYLYIHLFLFLSFYLSVYLSIYIYLCAHSYFYQSFFLSFYLSIYLYIFLSSIFLSIYLSILTLNSVKGYSNSHCLRPSGTLREIQIPEKFPKHPLYTLRNS